MDDRPLELQEDQVAEGDRVGEVLEAVPVLREPRDRKDPGARTQRDDEPLVADLDRPGDGLDTDGLALAIVGRHVTEEQLRVRAHLPEGDDHVPGLERSGCRLGKERRVQHEVLERDDGRAAALQEARDVAAGEPPSEDERPTACLTSLHGSCLPRWGSRYR
jgi:hypothetical protein